MTYGDMCRLIAKAGFLVKGADNRHPTAKEIWNYSPTGELDMIPAWFSMAVVILEIGDPVIYMNESEWPYVDDNVDSEKARLVLVDCPPFE